MANVTRQQFLFPKDLQQMLSISRAKAYNIIKQMNSELAEKGYITVSGRVSAKYAYERLKLEEG